MNEGQKNAADLLSHAEEKRSLNHLLLKSVVHARIMLNIKVLKGVCDRCDRKKHKTPGYTRVRVCAYGMNLPFLAPPS